MFMSKLLYSQSTQQTFGYPRSDDEPIVGLDPDFLVLTQVETTPPAITENQSLSSSYVVDTQALTYTQQWTIVDNPPAIDWDGFNEYMLTDATFKTYRDAVRAIDGDLNSALFDTYGLVATNGVGAFSLVWGQWVTVSGISAQDRDAIAVVAEGFNLPGDFVAVIRGSV